MVFTENDIVVKTWVKYVRNGKKKLEDVPDIGNLIEIVTDVLKKDN